MSMTKADLAKAVLQRLNVIGAGESPTSDDQALVIERYDSLYPQLRKIGLAPFTATAIDDWAQTGLIDIVASAVGPEFGWADRFQILAAWDNSGRRALSAQVQQDKRNIPIKAGYF